MKYHMPTTRQCIEAYLSSDVDYPALCERVWINECDARTHMSLARSIRRQAGEMAYRRAMEFQVNKARVATRWARAARILRNKMLHQQAA